MRERVAAKFCVVSCCIGVLVTAPAFGQVTVTAVGPGTALAGDTVTFEALLSAAPGKEFNIRAYLVVPPCELAPQNGATGAVDGALILCDCNSGNPDWVMCNAPCNCICAGVTALDFGTCDEDPPGNPRVGWAMIFASDAAAVGVGPYYLAETSYTVSGDATGGFNFEFQNPEVPGGNLGGSGLRDQNGDPVFADWIGTKLVIVDCVDDADCDDGIDCTVDTCVVDTCVNAPDDGFCDDGNECTDDACDQPGPGTGCSNTNVADGSACGDGSDTDCDDPDTCLGGSCQDNNEPDGSAPAGLCDDGNDCTQDNCSGGACANPNEADGTACGSGSDTDCDNPDTCSSGSCQDNNEPNGTACPDDGNGCTDDECSGGSCDHPNNSDPCDDGIFCNGADTCGGGSCSGHAGDPCAGGDECKDQCNEGTQDCFTSAGTECTDDGDICTEDACDGVGNCVSTEIPDCAIPVCINAEGAGGGRAGLDCVPLGEPILVTVDLGASNNLVGAQFRVDYDPNALTLTGFGPGSDCDVESEFNTLLDSVEGDSWVFLMVATGGTGAPCDDNDGCGPGGVCLPNGFCLTGDVSDGGTAACLYFDQKGGCDNSDLCLCETLFSKEECNPYIVRIVNSDGAQLPTQDCPEGVCADVSPETPIVFNQPCGDGQCVATADCERPTGIVHWDPPLATDECGDLVINCDCTGTPEQCADWLANNGGEFPQGEYEFWCVIEDVSKCKEVVEVHWTVLVTDDTTLELEIQLSPQFADDADGIIRGIEFELYESCAPFEIITRDCEDITFGGPYGFAGHFSGEVKVPKGQYICIAARDSLHTLRSSSDLFCDRADQGGTGNYSAFWKGDPTIGGNWLTAGNLDGNRTNETGSPHVIDIVDYGIFVSQFMSDVGADTPCDSKDIWDDFGGHADVNGDGFVDDLDFTFIAINFLLGDKDVCCPDRGGDGYPEGRTEISVRDLNKMGLSHLAVGDLNGDGMLDLDDMQAFMAGVRPKRPGTSR